MDLWQQLTATALVGTDRQTPTPPTGDGTLAAALQQLDWEEPERAILGAAGAISLHHQVGQRPLRHHWSTFAPCPPDDTVEIQPFTVRHLDMVMDSNPDLLPELLGLIAEAVQHIPPWQLPKLLRLGQQKSELRPAILSVVGKRGQWLATYSTDWSYARASSINEFTPDNPELQAIWEKGRRNERILLLKQWRSADATVARAALEKVWSSEAAKEREAFVTALAVELSMADEPFLEQALDDRAKGVRRAAVGVLSRLPESRLCQRVAARLQQFVQVNLQANQGTIAVTLPEGYDPGWERDGIQRESSVRKGDKSGWIGQMLSIAPLSIWGEPTAIAQALKGHRWQYMMMQGWQGAIADQKRTDWAIAFLEGFDLLTLNQSHFFVEDILGLIPLETKEAFLRENIPSKTDKETLAGWLRLTAAGSQVWSLDFSKIALKQLFEAVRGSHRNTHNLAYITRDFAKTLHPNVATELFEAVEALQQSQAITDYWQGTMDRLISQINLRQAIYQVFRSG